MPIRFTCPNGHRLKVPDEKAGRGMLCPVCQESVRVPEAELTLSDTLPPEPPPIDLSGQQTAVPQSAPMDAPPAPLSPQVPVASIQGGVSEPGPVPTAAANRRDAIPWGLVGGLFLVLAYSSLPALGHLRDVPMAPWVRILLGAILLQFVFVIWMLTVRHWVALAIVGLLFGLTSIGYASVAVLAFAGGDDASIPWGMESIRSRAAVWSATVLAVYLLATYSCVVASLRWRLEMSCQSVR